MLQIPLEAVPDARLRARHRSGELPSAITIQFWQEMEQWLAGRGLRIVVHRKVPAARRRWIGIVRAPGHFNDHCLVMDRGEVLFDPAADVGLGALAKMLGRENVPTLSVTTWGPDDVDYGISFQQIGGRTWQ